MPSPAAPVFLMPDASDAGRRALRDALGQFATGVTIITTLDAAGKDIGLTVNSFASVSLDPPLILWSIAANSQHVAAFAVGVRFAVHILGQDQAALARHFGRPGVDRFAAIEPELEIGRGLGGVPLLGGVIAIFECLLETVAPAGDHHILIARVERFAAPGGAPLTFFAGRFGGLGAT